MAKPKKKQLEIPGAERQVIPEIEELAAPYTAALYQRQDLQVQENDLREQLGVRMRELGVEKYTYHDGEATFLIALDETVKVKCRRVKDTDGDVATE